MGIPRPGGDYVAPGKNKCFPRLGGNFVAPVNKWNPREEYKYYIAVQTHLTTVVPLTRKKMPFIEILNQQIMWMEAFGLTSATWSALKPGLREKGRVWSPEVMEKTCEDLVKSTGIRNWENRKVQGCHFNLQICLRTAFYCPVKWMTFLWNELVLMIQQQSCWLSIWPKRQKQHLPTTTKSYLVIRKFDAKMVFLPLAW
jgi:hypothetical protein